MDYINNKSSKNSNKILRSLEYCTYYGINYERIKNSIR